MIPVKRVKISKGLVFSILIHTLLLCALFNGSIGNKNIQQKTIKYKPIDSYIYQPPQIKEADNPQSPIKTEQIYVEEIQPSITRKVLETRSNVIVKEKFHNNQTVQSKIAVETLNTLDSKVNTTNKKASLKGVFNPYESMLSVNKNLDQAMINDAVATHKQDKGISSLQALMPSVPTREYVKSSLQIREEATTIVGNETFIKLNGTCAQSTDLSFIDENLGSVTSYSDCGETDDEKYFRKFMKNRMGK